MVCFGIVYMQPFDLGDYCCVVAVATMRHSLHCGPLTAMATTMGSSSLKAIAGRLIDEVHGLGTTGMTPWLCNPMTLKHLCRVVIMLR